LKRKGEYYVELWTELGLYNLDAVLEMYKHNFRCQIMSAARMLL